MAPLVYAWVEVFWCLRLVTDPCTRSAGLPTFEEGACWQFHQEEGEQDHPDADPLADIQVFTHYQYPKRHSHHGIGEGQHAHHLWAVVL